MKKACREIPAQFIRKRTFMSIKRVILLHLCLACLVHAEPLTLPLEQRPDWLHQDGIVMAGSWEPLLFRVRRDGSQGYTPTVEQRADYLREHSPEMIEKLKALGVNFIMMHCYKGAGLEAERESMADAVKFAKLCHDAGLKVGVYSYSGAFIWELLFKEVPQARDWVILYKNGRPLTYGKAAYQRIATAGTGTTPTPGCSTGNSFDLPSTTLERSCSTSTIIRTVPARTLTPYNGFATISVIRSLLNG